MVRFTILVATGAALLAAGGAGANPQQAGRPDTLVAKSPRITRFAQDGDWVAWTTTDERCRLRLHLFSLRQGRQVVSVSAPSDDCYEDSFEQLALAGDRVVMAQLVGADNNELDVDVLTSSARAPRPRLVREMTMTRDWEAAMPDPPPVAGRGNTLVYYRHEDGVVGSPAHTVEQVLGSHPRRVFGLRDPVALAVDRGRIASAQRLLLRGDACNCNFDPAWSPDGTKIAYLSGRFCCNGGQSAADVYVENADGSGRTRITSDGRPKSGLAWSPDGTRLAYGYYDAAFNRRVAVVGADGSGRHDVADGTNPAWSPDGTKLAYDDSFHLYVANADGSSASVIGIGTRPAWAPDGTRIAYDDPSRGVWYTSRPDGSDTQMHESTLTSLAWSPDGAEIAGANGDGIAVVDAGRGQPVWLAGTERGDDNPSWSRDGLRILFDSARNDLDRDPYPDPELYVVGRGGSAAHAVNYTVADEWYTPVQVHDGRGRLLARARVRGAALGLAVTGRRLVVLAQPARSSERYLSVIDARNGKLLRVIHVPSAAVGPLSASGGRVVFAAGRTIRAADVASGAVRLLAYTSRRVVGVAVSGRRVTWAESDGRRGQVRTLLLR